MDEHEKAKELVEKAWKNLGNVQFLFFGTARVEFSIEKEGGKYLAMLSVSNADRGRRRELVRIFFGAKKTRRTQGMFCTMYSAEYDAPAEAKEVSQ